MQRVGRRSLRHTRPSFAKLTSPVSLRYSLTFSSYPINRRFATASIMSFNLVPYISIFGVLALGLFLKAASRGDLFGGQSLKFVTESNAAAPLLTDKHAIVTGGTSGIGHHHHHPLSYIHTNIHTTLSLSLSLSLHSRSNCKIYNIQEKKIGTMI